MYKLLFNFLNCCSITVVPILPCCSPLPQPLLPQIKLDLSLGRKDGQTYHTQINECDKPH